MPARWVAAARRSEAEALGYVVVEPTTVVATHLLETLKGSAAELLGRQEVQEMVETLKKSHPALVEEIIPGKVSLSVLHRVLQRLLRERVPIRDLVTILEALHFHSLFKVLFILPSRYFFAIGILFIFSLG